MCYTQYMAESSSEICGLPEIGLFSKPVPTAPAPIGKRLAFDLTEDERVTLRGLTKATKRVVAQRAALVLALEQGESSTHLAQKYGVHPVTVRHLKQQFRARRLEAIQPGKPTGRPPSKRQAVEAFLEQQAHYEQRSMLQTPEDGILSTAAIRHKLQHEQHLHVCINTVRSALKKKGSATGE